MIIPLLFLIVFLISLYIYISYNYQKKKESFTNSSEISNYNSNNNQIIKTNNFIRGRTPDFLKDWSRILDNYVKNFNTVNLNARNVKSQEELYNKYYPLAGIPISNDLINKIKDYLNNELNELRIKLSSQEFLLNYLDKLFKTDFRIVKMSNDMEEGFPHTYENYMFLPERWFRNPSISTFIHELVHISQRENKTQFSKLYKSWQFRKLNYNDIPHNFTSNILKRNRVNPDGLSSNWFWIADFGSDVSYWIGAIFNDENPASLSDVNNEIYYFKVSSNTNNTATNLEFSNIHQSILSNKEYTKFFGNIQNNNYHPNEISAEMITEIILQNSSNEKKTSKAELILLDWIKTFL